MTDPSSGSDLERPAVFFDRDGVVNRSPGENHYVHSWKEFAFNPGFFEIFKWVKDQGCLAILVTSQKGVGKGVMSQGDLDEIHRCMQEELRRATGFGFDGIYAYTGTDDCRHQPKPEPEMILTAAKDHNIDLSRSWMIGDADRDIEMGIAADLKGTIRVKGEKEIGVEATETVSSVGELEALLARLLL